MVTKTVLGAVRKGLTGIGTKNPDTAIKEELAKAGVYIPKKKKK